MSGTRSSRSSIHKVVSLPPDCDPRNIFFIIGHGHEKMSSSGATKGLVPENTTLIAASHCGLPVSTKLQVVRFFNRAKECTLRASDGKSDYYESGEAVPNMFNSLVLDYVNDPMPRDIPAHRKNQIILRTDIEVAKSGVFSVYNMPGFKAKTFEEYTTAPASLGDWDIQENNYKLVVKKHKVAFTWNIVVLFDDEDEVGAQAAVAALEDHVKKVLEMMLSESHKGSLIRGKYDIGFRQVILDDGQTLLVKPYIRRKSSIHVYQIVDTINKVRSKGSVESPHLYVYYIGCRTFNDPDIARYTRKYTIAFNTIFNYAIGTYRSFFLKTRAEWNAMLKPMLTVTDMFRYRSALDEAEQGDSPDSPGTQAIFEKVLEFKQWLFADLPSRGAPLLLQMIRKVGDQYPDDAVLRVARTPIEKEEAAEFKAKLKVIQEASKL